MYEPNVSLILKSLKPSDKVLDIGGWACPFNRADYVMDAEPYETRGYYRTIGGPPSQGGDAEHFAAETWIRRDICDREPYPFADKEFDFVICSHTLEDLRDPLFVCSEMIRVGRRGYIEMPSREWETCRGCESPNIAGLSHHRWLAEIDGDEITFLMKYHMIHSHWRFNFPPAHLREMPEAGAFQWLHWEGSFTFSERTIHGVGEQAAELESFVRRVRPYPAWRLAADAQARGVLSHAQRIGRGVRRRLFQPS
jgi:hypothetical protein